MNTDTLIDFGRRLYDPQLGRFLTPDPAGYSDSPNRYAYVANQAPYLPQDPFGLTMGGNPTSTAPGTTPQPPK